MDLLRIASRVAAVEETAVPEDWSLISDDQVEQVLKMMPPGAKVHGSRASGKSDRFSDLDVTLPKDIGEKALSKLVAKVVSELDLNFGAVNVGMPCSKHENCTVLAQVNETHVLPPLVEHIKGGIRHLDEFTPEERANRDWMKEMARETMGGADESAFQLPPGWRNVLKTYAEGATDDEIREAVFAALTEDDGLDEKIAKETLRFFMEELGKLED